MVQVQVLALGTLMAAPGKAQLLEQAPEQ